jgi:Pyruvate/2-oxoacid:ferredoxin oxidoreductase delta subunit
MIEAGRALPRVILYEGPGAEPLDREWRVELLRELLERGFAVRRVVGREISLAAFDEATSPLVIGRLVVPPASATTRTVLRFRDIAGKSLSEVVELVNSAFADTTSQSSKRWKPWFPVIDPARCTHCMQCLSFCLFGVYGVTADGKLQVQNESNCKTDCPACSRVCPEVAIMFPKYKAGPINGEPINSEDVRRETVKVDISALLGGDVYALLRDRSARAKSRFSKERDDDRALKERQRCLEQLKSAVQGLDIPPEVLASLPSPEQIQQKALEAQQRARQALNQAFPKNGVS